MFINFFSFFWFAQSQAPRTVPGQQRILNRHLLEEGREGGVKKDLWWSSRDTVGFSGGIPDMEEKLGQLGSFTTNVRFHMIQLFPSATTTRFLLRLFATCLRQESSGYKEEKPLRL